MLMQRVRLVVVCALATVLVAGPARASESTGDPLGQLSTAIEQLADRIGPSVVQILTTGYGPVDDTESLPGALVGRQQGLGAGVVIDAEGYIATNAHVVSGAQHIQVVLPVADMPTTPMQSLAGARGRTVDARLVGTAPELDLALLKVDVKGLRALPYAN